MKTVVVTGGTRRLGGYIAARLRADGWRVITTSSRADAGADLLADLSVPGGAVKLYADVLRLLGGNPPDALVNNAALFIGDEAAIETLDFLAPQKLTILMAGRETGRGTVVNILDAQVLAPGYTPRAESAAYDRAKLALRDFTLKAAEMFADTLDVRSVAPGPVLPPEGFHLKAGVPPDQRPTPESVADAVAELLKSAFDLP